MPLRVDFLIILMSLAGQHDDVGGAGTGDQLGDGLAATGHERHLGRRRKAGTNIVEYAHRVFGPRVVVGHQHPVGQALGHFCHQRALAPVTVAATAEQAQQLPVGMRAQGLEHFFQGIGRVRVIDHHQGPFAAAQALHAANRTVQLRHDLEDLVQRVIQCQQGRHGRQYVAEVEATQQLRAQRALALGGDEGGADAIVVECGLGAIQRGVGVLQAVADQPGIDAIGHRLASVGVSKALTEVVVQIDHLAAQAWPGKQLGLGRFIGLHAAVVVEVVTGQVGHHRDVERQGRYTPLFQGMGGHFHGHGPGALFFQVIQGRLHGDRVRRGQAAAFQLAVETRPQGTHQAATLAQ